MGNGHSKRIISHNPVLLKTDDTLTNIDGIIRLLPPEIANKIAAGEVVQRPSSVVKELLDNAIDSGASKITVILQNAGRTSIQVIDNGCGMSKNDIPNCFLRHATSKISSVDDLYNIRTLGFRGEAMASIASVSQISLKTKRHEDEVGYIYEADGGEEKTFEPVATENGTSISVKNLFYNVPARRSFLKTDATEFRHSIIVFQQMAMTTPEIAFELVADGEVVYKLQSQSLEARIVDIFGKSYKASLLPIDETAGSVRISGYLIDPKLTKRNRGEQFLFVNGRPVMHRHITHVLLEEYKNWVRDNEYPFFALFFDVDPAQVDVNVHPSKMEIKFEDDRLISSLTKSVIRRALNQRYQVPDVQRDEDNYFDPFPLSARGDVDFNSIGTPVQKIPSRINFDRMGPSKGPGRFTQDLYSASEVFQNNALKGDFQRPEREKSVGFWQLHNTYIVAQTLTGLCVVDQHAAHKRIIYERAMGSMESGIPSTQQLLFPQTLQLSASDFAELKNVLPEFLRLGFDIGLISGFTAIISGVPADIQLGDEKSLIQSMIQQYQGFASALNLEPRQKLALAMANKTAMARGKKLTQIEMETLMDQLFACKQPYVDPLQKPTITYIPLDDIRSRFRSH